MNLIEKKKKLLNLIYEELIFATKNDLLLFTDDYSILLNKVDIRNSDIAVDEAIKILRKLKEEEIITSYKKEYVVESDIFGMSGITIYANREKIAANLSDTVNKYKVVFDELNGVLEYGRERHKFQLGSRSNKKRLLLFKELWKSRIYFKSSKKIRDGQRIPLSAVAVRIELISSPVEFEKNKKAQRQMDSLIKGINRILSEKKFPMQIETHNKAARLFITDQEK